MLVNEADKLALYCYPNKTISVADVEAICGDQASLNRMRLIAAVLDGDVETADRIFASMALSGDAKSVLIMFQMYRCTAGGCQCRLGTRCVIWTSACRAAKPPVFDKQKTAAGRQVRVFSGDDLGQGSGRCAARHVCNHVRWLTLADAITARCLLSLARMARQLQGEGSGLINQACSSRKAMCSSCSRTL